MNLVESVRYSAQFLYPFLVSGRVFIVFRVLELIHATQTKQINVVSITFTR